MIRNETYLNFIRKMPCIICLAKQNEFLKKDYLLNELIICFHSEAHHVNKRGLGSMGKKTSDYRTIPLCPDHHREIHQIGKDSFSLRYQVDFEEVIQRLNQIWRDNDASSTEDQAVPNRP